MAPKPATQFADVVMIGPAHPAPTAWNRQRPAADLVARYTLLCAGAATIPVWWANSTSITGLQLKMLAGISRLYGVEFTQDLVRPLAASLAGGGLSLLISRNPLSLMFKSWVLTLPVVGVPLRFGMGPAMMAAYTYVLGHAFIRHYEAGGSYHDFEVKRLRKEGLSILGLAEAS